MDENDGFGWQLVADLQRHVAYLDALPSSLPGSGEGGGFSH